ncbi:transposase [Micromonospora sp. WMMD1102]|uniref:IS701 family transposase n=1 Tax=Micromonospora sp. WMMD1102 TaxID=3016105 RepID=UPI0024155008|nr:transposase [Micromonospora sp. WMMD1102]MDG4789572.1 transposase [Micromonospora sp. WMMD1102]
MTVGVETGATMSTARGGPDLSAFCRERLSSLSRADQRRWGEAYVRGLVTVPGRKSIRRISDQIIGWRADQCLQQFVNQSPWPWEPVRRNLAEHVAGLVATRAWVVREAVFPKAGSSSVGVARQYAFGAGRLLNCQLGLAVFLVGDTAACAVNWRLLLPRCWDDDQRRRARAHLPAVQRYRPRWLHPLDAIDEMINGWKLPPRPVLVDADDQQDVQPLLTGLEQRGLCYLVQVAPHLRVPAAPGACPAPSFGELALCAVRPPTSRLRWQAGTELRTADTRFVASPLPPGNPMPVGDHPFQPTRHLLAQWAVGRGRPRGMWLTNLDVARLPEVIDLIGLRARAAEHLWRMEDEVGLRHFEGRSFRGWHHHTTLASVAYAYRLGAAELPSSWYC